MKATEIKDILKTSNIKQWELAENLDVSEFTVCRWLRKDVPADIERKIMNAIVEISNERGTSLPVGFVVRREGKSTRRSFALRRGVFEEFRQIAENKGTNVNALLNDILEEYVKNEIAEAAE